MKPAILIGAIALGLLCFVLGREYQVDVEKEALLMARRATSTAERATEAGAAMRNAVCDITLWQWEGCR